MPVRELSPDLLTALQAARRVEDAVATRQQRSRAVAATSILIWAAARAGWRIVDLAPAVGLRPTAAARRVAVVRARFGGQPPPGIAVDPPPNPSTVATILAVPLAERQWLTTPEAADHAGISMHGIRLWMYAGLLPHTDRSHHSRVLFLRADLDRVMRGPRYRNGGVDRRRLLAQLEAESGL